MRVVKTTSTVAIYVALILQGISIPGQIQISSTNPTTEMKKLQGKETKSPEKKPLSPGEKRACDLLIATIRQSSQIEDVVDRSQVISPASVVLWKYNEERSRATIAANLDVLLGQYQKHLDNNDFQKIEDEIKNVAGQIASRDTKLSMTVLSQLHDLKESLRGNGRTWIDVSEEQMLDDRIQIARETLSTDPKQAVAIGSQILESGVTRSFPNLLYSIGDRDKSQADTLFRQALQVMKKRSVYGWVDHIYLSSYVFKERFLMLPAIAPGEHGLDLFNSAGHPVDPEIAREFLIAAFSDLSLSVANNFINPTRRGDRPDDFYYLADKYAYYAALYDPTSVDSWFDLKARLAVMVKNAGKDPDRYRFRSDFIDAYSRDREQTEDRAKPYFDIAENTDDNELRERSMVSGSLELIWAGKYSEAEQSIAEFDRKITSDQVYDYLCMIAGEAALKQSNWPESLRRASEIGNRPARALLLIETAAAILKSGRQTKISVPETLNDALRLIYKADFSTTRTSLLIAVSSLLYRVGNRTEGARALQSAISDLNRDSNFEMGRWSLSFPMGESHEMISSEDDWDLNVAVGQAAVSDWDGAMLLISGIESAKLRLSAQIAAAQAPFSSPK
jgi:hypothetical protein